MSERMRGALFNALGELSGKTVLDAFAGSGAVGFEAISRGSKQVTFIEKDRTVINILKENISDLAVEQKTHVIQANVFGWVDTSQEQFDVVLIDPPYDSMDPQKAVEKLKKACNRKRNYGTITFR